jgi:hypothetical protein
MVEYLRDADDGALFVSKWEREYRAGSEAGLFIKAGIESGVLVGIWNVDEMSKSHAGPSESFFGGHSDKWAAIFIPHAMGDHRKQFV